MLNRIVKTSVLALATLAIAAATIIPMTPFPTKTAAIPMTPFPTKAMA
ncbi:MAG: hypothetical protein KGJ51_10255 [Acidobacteriota bacterium]|nr:hypothetical protein [Acidobacteriota bacterium]